LIFFLLIFLVAWAAGLWVSPRGSMVLGVYWLPILLAAVLFAVFLAAATPSARRPPEPPPEGIPDPDTPAERRRQWNIDVFFWVLLVAFLTVIVLGYVVQSPPAA
jgi:hypothetical protein